ncbi:MAG: hypothetical protein DCC71_10070 [Proteobacteria bacterium]|nr:MAG: hypothetical protein DCC71_10070 [Pseudomonadota bacterium]
MSYRGAPMPVLEPAAEPHASAAIVAPPAAPAAAPRITPAEWLCLVAGALLCAIYAWILDDGYVYFKYVDNWVLLGRGLVYNPGEYAEGFTSPAWLLLLAGLRWLGLDYWLAVRAIALLAFVAFWIGAVAVGRRLAPDATPRWNLPLVLLCFSYPVLSYFSSGTESPLVQLAAVAYALCLLRPGWWPAEIAVGLSPLVRPELALASFVVIAWLAWSRRRVPWVLVATGAATSGGWLLFRALYYADLFPTTYYLKAEANPAQGWRYLHDTLAPYHLYGWLALGGVGLFAVRRARAEPDADSAARLAMLAAAASIALYVAWIGGDARHYRYLAFPVCLALLAFAGIAEHAVRRARVSVSRASVAIAAAALALWTASLHPRQLDGAPLARMALPGPLRDVRARLFGRPDAGQARIVDKIADAAMHRSHHPTLPALSPWKRGDAIDLRAAYAGRAAAPPFRVNAATICWDHYARFDEWSIHGFGLTDAVLARVRVPASPDDRPGHTMRLPALAQDLAAIVAWWGRPPAAGMYRAAVAAGVAAPWVGAHLDTLELLERKLYGPRGAAESLALALRVRERIDLR